MQGTSRKLHAADARIPRPRHVARFGNCARMNFRRLELLSFAAGSYL
jgi:hypothetical protein